MFRNAKVGDRVFDILLGWGIVDNINLILNLPLRVKFDVGLSNYTLDGKTSPKHIKSRLYWDEIKFDIPEKPFDLKGEFDKLEFKKFERDEFNEFIYFSTLLEEWFLDYSTIDVKISELYFEKTDELYNFIDLLNEHKITPEQLRPLMLKKLREVYGE